MSDSPQRLWRELKRRNVLRAITVYAGAAYVILELVVDIIAAMVYEITVADNSDFLAGCGAGFYYSGVEVRHTGNAIELRYPDGSLIPDNTTLSLGINDYIPAVHESWFLAGGNQQSYTTAEAIIYYFENMNSQVDYPGCNHYFRDPGNIAFIAIKICI